MSLLLPKLLFVCLYSLYGSALAYITIYYKNELYLRSNQIGFILSISPFVQIIACPLWTLIADKYSKFHGPLMGILVAIGGSSVLSLYFIAPSSKEPDDSNQNVFLLTALCAIIFAFFGSPICALVDSAVLKMLGDQKILYGSQRLWGSISNALHIFVVGLLISKFGIQIIFYVFFIGGLTFILLSMFVKFDHHRLTNNNSTHDNTQNSGFVSQPEEENEDGRQEQNPLLETSGKNYSGKYLYSPEQEDEVSIRSSGQQRLRRSTRQSSSSSITRPFSFRARANSFANTIYLSQSSIYHSLSSYPTSIIAMDTQIEAGNELSNSNDFPPPLGLSLSYIPTIDTSLSAFASIITNSPEDNNIVVPEKTILKSMLVYTFLISVTLYGLAHSMISQFLFLLLNDLGLDSFLIGLTGPIGGIAEVITFWFSKQLFDRFSVTCLTIAVHLAFIFRAMMFTCLRSHDPKSMLIALALQAVNGFAYALMWSTAVAEVDSFFPADQRSIAQGLLAALFSGLGYGLGCILGGYIYGVYGSVKLFQVSAFICLISLVVFLSGRRRTAS